MATPQTYSVYVDVYTKLRESTANGGNLYQVELLEVMPLDATDPVSALAEAKQKGYGAPIVGLSSSSNSPRKVH